MLVRLAALSAACLALSSACYAENQPRRLATAGAPSVAAFLDSIGVNTHWKYTDTPYSYAYGEVSRLLIESGIRHMRAICDEAPVLDLWRRGRVRSTVSFEPAYGSLASQVNCVKATNAQSRGQAIAAVEGANEPELFWAPRRTLTYRGQGFPAGPKLWQQDLFNALNADPATAGLPVIGMSFGVTYGSAPTPYAEGELAPYADWGNAHPYPSNGEPFTSRQGYGGLAWYYGQGNNPGINIAEEQFLYSKLARQYAPKPMAVTENGYSTYRDGTPNLEVHAIYMPRLFAESFRVGIKRTLSYEFIDAFADPENDDPGSNYGLVKRDLTPKPAYVALKSLLTRLRRTEADPPLRPTPPTRELRLTIDPPAGYDRTEYVRSLLLKRADGGFALLLWHEISGENNETEQRLRHPAIPVTVAFSLPAASAKRYAYNGDWALVQTNRYADVASVSLAVDERISILFFK